MAGRIFDKKNVILLKINEEDILSFLVDKDLTDDGKFEWRLNDLADAIINAIPEYVFAEYENSSYDATEVVAKLREAAKSIYRIPEYDLMRRYYVDNDQDALAKISSSGYVNRGEFGELLLHLLLREFKGTIPLISKVYFKDSSRVPAHGFDAVHISPEDEIIWLGESKLYTDAKRGLDALISDLKEHFKHDYLEEQFIIIKKNLENNTIPQRDYWIERLNSTPKLADQLKMINIPLLCVYNDKIYEVFDYTNGFEASQYHQVSVRELKDYFDKQNDHPLKAQLNIILFMFSIKDKREFVGKLHERLWHMQNM